MPAFNARLKPKTWGGIPILSLFGLVIALASGLMALLLPMVFAQFVFSLLALSGILLFIVALYYGDDLRFVPTKNDAFQDQRSQTIETDKIE